MLGKFYRKAKPDQHFELDLPEVDKAKQSAIARLQSNPDEAAEIVIPPSRPPLISSKNIALIAVILMLLAAGLGIWSWTRFNTLNDLRQSEVIQHETEIDSLLQIKAGLENHLDQLQASFTDLSADNDTLAQRLAISTNIVAEKGGGYSGNKKSKCSGGNCPARTGSTPANNNRPL